MRYGHIASRSRVDRPDYNALKTTWQATIAAYAKKQRLPEAAKSWRWPIALSWRWYEPDARRDPDGISGGGRKLIVDALTSCTGRCRQPCGMHAGVFPTDGHRHVQRFRWEEFYVGLESERGGAIEAVTVGIYEGERIVGVFVVPARLPDLNELLAARELGARRMVRS